MVLTISLIENKEKHTFTYLKTNIMKKVVAVSNFPLYGCRHITTIKVYEGEEFPSDWEWLRKFLTTWTLTGKSLMWGEPNMRFLRDRYGDDAEIKTYY